MVLICFKEVFKNKKFIILSLSVSFLFLIFAILLPNTPLLIQLFQDFDEPLLKVQIIGNLLDGIVTNFTASNRMLTFIIAILFGLYTSLLVYFLKKRKEIVTSSGSKTGFIGLISGIFGIGCASCGSFLLSLIFSTIGAVGIIAFLPLKGVEFAILSVVLLSFSIYTMSKTIVNACMCKVS